jgi:molybdopterin converting factor small subunit
LAEASAAAAIRVRLPAHLRQLAHCEREVTVQAEPTQRGVIDALEASFPGLRGTLREPGSGRRRAFVRFYACEEDLSHEPPDAPLPPAVVEGREPFLVIGAMAGG